MTQRLPVTVYFFTFVLAFCSLFYELVYAQILSVSLGGTKIQYFTIISLFTCALGFGSLAYGRMKLKYPLRKMFFFVELSLTLLGALGPFLITWLLQPGSTGVPVFGFVILSYVIVALIGFLSGFEIPSLFAMVKNAQGKILAFDYLGMLGASLLFPFFFLPVLGTAASTLIVAGANGLALIWLRSDEPSKKLSVFLYGLCLVYFFVVATNVEALNDLLSSLYLGGQ